MKRIFLSTVLLLSVIPALLTSCEKDKPLSDTMIGKWDVEYVTQVTYKSNTIQSEYKQYLTAGTITIQFVSGGSGIYSDADGDYLFNWTLNGQVVTITNLYQTPTDWDLTMDGDKLVWSYKDNNTEDTTITYEIFFTAQRKS